MCGRNIVQAHRRQAERGQHHRHRVGGELAAAGAGAGTGVFLHRRQLGVADLAGAVRADGFEHLLDGDRMAVVRAVRDAAAVKRDGWDVESRHRHRRGGNGLVAAAQHHHRVQAVAVDGQLDRIGDDLAADQRGAHARGAHGDAVSHRDGVELDRRTAGGAHAGCGVFGQFAQVEVARADVGPRMHDRHQRLGDGLIVQSGSAQHRAGGSPVGAGFYLITTHEKFQKF
jgi:hypothetical protein